MRDAKMEAMGLRPEDHEQKQGRNQMATDEMVSFLLFPSFVSYIC